MAGLGIDVVGSSPKAFEAYIASADPEMVLGHQGHRIHALT